MNQKKSKRKMKTFKIKDNDKIEEIDVINMNNHLIFINFYLL